ncbi:MAG: hypothetical protein IIA60_09230 [Candidatus Marinimicrobia bacterium]|nr:hypothetical protein [Candidatus Neomarinimicrobiota bacterium]
MRLLIFLIIIIASTSALTAQDTRTFSLKSGDRISGSVVAETDTSYEVLTSLGVLTILKSDLLPEIIIIDLKSGDRLQGELLELSEAGLRVRTALGDLFIEHAQIERFDFVLEGGAAAGLDEPAGQRWYFSEERLMDIWFDPTGFPLRKGEFYLSALSWAVGFTDRIQVSTRWANFFWGDLNVRPKITIYESGGIESQTSVSIGGHLHTRGLPGKYEYSERSWFSGSGIWDPITQTYSDTTWHSGWTRVGSELGKYGRSDPDGINLWIELFGAYSVSRLNQGNQGRTNYTVGGTVTFYPGADPMPRLYIGWDRDVRRDVKILAEVFYDPYYVPLFIRDTGEDVVAPFFFDFGFMTNRLFSSDRLWFGIHYQQPFVAFYFKF